MSCPLKTPLSVIRKVKKAKKAKKAAQRKRWIVLAKGYDYPGTNGNDWIKEWKPFTMKENFTLKLKFRIDGPSRVGGSVNLIHISQTGGCCGSPGDALCSVFIQQDTEPNLFLCVAVGTNCANTLNQIDPRNYEAPEKVAFHYGEEMEVVIHAEGSVVTVSQRDFSYTMSGMAPGEARITGKTQVQTPGPPFVPITGVLHEARIMTWNPSV